MPIKTGDLVRVRPAESAGEWCRAVVELASGNGKSVALRLEGAVRAGGGLVMGILPLTIDYEAETVTSLLGDEYEIEVNDKERPS